jgi:hypothetical protein
MHARAPPLRDQACPSRGVSSAVLTPHQPATVGHQGSQRLFVRAKAHADANCPEGSALQCLEKRGFTL